MATKTDPNGLLHGTLDALVLKTLARGRCTATASRNGSKRPPTRRSSSKRARSIRRSIGWSAASGSKRNGARRSSAAGRSSIGSPRRGAAGFWRRRSSGRASPPACRKCCWRANDVRAAAPIALLEAQGRGRSRRGVRFSRRDADARARRARHGPGRGARGGDPALRRHQPGQPGLPRPGQAKG